MKKLSGKVAIVTGASKGIGAAIAKSLGAAGASVAVNYASDQEGANAVVAEILRSDGRAIAVRADVSKPDDVKRLFAETRQSFGPANVLVNNAGVYRFAPADALDIQEFHRQFGINVLGPLLTIQQAAQEFGHEGGSIINVSSVVAWDGPAGTSIYSATKAALDSVTRVLAKELGPKKIRVNSINPGLTETEGAHTLGVIESEFAKQVVHDTPLGRVGVPEDIAPAVVFLASEEASWITGESLRVSGGLR